MAYNDTLFRTQMPEFSNTTTYPSTMLSMFWTLATNFIQQAPDSWDGLVGDSLAFATNLMGAHLLTLQAQAAAGQTTGFEVGATIDKISVQKLAPPAKDGLEFYLCQTPYGQTLWALLDTILVGGISVGGSNERGSFRKAGGCFW